MKTRNGFISNSSSSSFVVKRTDFRDIFSLAKAMIPARKWEEEDKLLIKKINQTKNISPNHPISFSSCNYNTFIILVDDYYLITTCHNHDWEDYLDEAIMGKSFPIGLKEKMKFPINYFEDLEKIEYNYKFWFPEWDIIGTMPDPESPYERCDKNKDHWAEFIIPSGKRKAICPICYKGQKDKLQKQPKINKKTRFDLLDLRDD